MLRQYETVFIVTPVLSESQMKEAVSKFKKFLTDSGAEIVHSENWGLKKLAYPIQKKTTGFYNLIEFKAEPEFVGKLEIEYRRDERIIRFLTFKMDKYAIEYSEKKRNIERTRKKIGGINYGTKSNRNQVFNSAYGRNQKEKILQIQKESHKIY